MAIDALLERDLLQEIVDADRDGLVDLAIDGDLPRADAQLLGFRRDPLGCAEFIEIIVVCIVFLIGDGAPGIPVGGIRRGRIEALGRIALRPGRIGETGQSSAGKPG
jgi:hypothetical protein